MRRTFLLLTPLLLAGCIKDSATYYLDANTNEHVITVRAEQEYFWDKRVTTTLVAAHMPECLRRYPLSKMNASAFKVELFSNGDNVYTVRAGSQIVQVDTQTCAQLAEPAADALGTLVGTYTLDEDKVQFEKAPGAPEPAPATEPEATQ